MSNLIEERIPAVAALLLGTVNAPEQEIWKIARAAVTMVATEYEQVLAGQRELVRRLDVALNGSGAAKQASLCDLVAQFEKH